MITTYEKPDGDLIKYLEKYAQKKEEILVSSQLEFRGKLYREVIFNKKSLIKNQTTGIMYIDEKLNTVKDENLAKELAHLAYNYEIFYGNKPENSIFNAINDEGGLNREKNDLDLAIKGLDYVANSGVDKTEFVKDIINKIFIIRQETNSKLIELKKVIDEYSYKDAFNKDILDKIEIYYEEILGLNFENINNISSGIEYYDSIEDIIKKKKRSFIFRFKKKITEPIFKLDYQISYFKRLINVCDPVINMNKNQYLKFINNTQKENINGRVKLLRK